MTHRTLATIAAFATGVLLGVLLGVTPGTAHSTAPPRPVRLIPPLSFTRPTPSPSVSRDWMRSSLFAVAVNALSSPLSQDTTQAPAPTGAPVPRVSAAAATPTSPSAVRASGSQLRSVAAVPPAPAATAGEGEQAGPSVWDRLAQCESGGNWSINTGNGFEGGLQFLNSTWLAMGGGKYAQHAYDATRKQQIAIAEKTLAASSWAQQWPACSKEAGLR